MFLKDKITSEPGFQYVVDAVELMSAAGRRRMLQQPLMRNAADINAEYDNIDAISACLQNESMKREVDIIRHQLMQMHDLQGTLTRLAHGAVLEEIELFELKSFAFLCRNTIKAAKAMKVDHVLRIPDVDDVFVMLDPDATGIPNFYIYDSYHPDLPELRKQMKALQTRLDGGKAGSDESSALQRQINELFEKHNAIQQQVIVSLSARLVACQPRLQQALDSMAYTDLLFAKATLAKQWHLCRPEVHDSGRGSHFDSLWNPRLCHRNGQLGLRYQPVDIEVRGGVCLITGANMAGKTVLLKTVGIAQLMAQFGFFVPAATAEVGVVDDVVFCIGDEQNEMNGLSSFASEITKISVILERARQENLLILIDEPARTTNPIEGKAIVQAIATLLDRQPSATLITTHYSQLGLTCRRLRVRGFVEDMADIPLSPDNINRFMDYSLMPDDGDEVPQEALRIASILRCDAELLDTARSFAER